MALRNAVLAALIDRESSGYDLAKRFRVSVANFWTATPQQLYRELDRMESEGLLAARLVKQDRRPDKRIFSVTEAGRAALLDFTRQEPKPTTVRDELLVQVEALAWADPASVRSSIEARIEQSRRRLTAYEQMVVEILGSRSHAEFLATGNRIGPYLTLQRGISFERENITWGELALQVLQSRSM
ncbi:PadR family transcriptional regulator [Actinoplanes sp. SE50]|uniref:PadR family transcriptional regulator n=1 Tax=unclassified Actinoplanes TaxID=2626549 RepID=UPI00023EC9B2|nr:MULTISPECIES: PadR family transcriptional regulator [unclassified Actinoplanes]AEV85396.1 Negative transcription regulator padR [Actinoplanes sp. SE50/110]ATO83791.1 PadR family transcriptional regulator [Actinoplanes sp. SE50]SLM01199.1 PadR family transcriptional regulator [Actinoplanes sp. SE50/110]